MLNKMYVPKGLKKLGLAAVLTGGLVSAGCSDPVDPHVTAKVTNDWVSEEYAPAGSGNVIDSVKKRAYVIEDCSSGKCVQYTFPGKDEDVYRLSVRIKRGDRIRFLPGDSQSIQVK